MGFKSILSCGLASIHSDFDEFGELPSQYISQSRSRPAEDIFQSPRRRFTSPVLVRGTADNLQQLTRGHTFPSGAGATQQPVRRPKRRHTVPGTGTVTSKHLIQWTPELTTFEMSRTPRTRGIDQARRSDSWVSGKRRDAIYGDFRQRLDKALRQNSWIPDQYWKEFLKNKDNIEAILRSRNVTQKRNRSEMVDFFHDMAPQLFTIFVVEGGEEHLLALMRAKSLTKVYHYGTNSSKAPRRSQLVSSSRQRSEKNCSRPRRTPMNGQLGIASTDWSTGNGDSWSPGCVG
ncbi:hypothetical protein B0T26DRAFT_704928 [Lasiosphaeria miniovina]|uniref:Uncharacterized protein n=1 Tax=Lasiosphaeria miniovina TaxID=1954250 RepID=A0AA40AVX5_9PEZI|nr:uncharacterized protein B0T26DRAFT_704928 [Lasiosphaeria miniovina]KAK0723000.1 hypothetical protein B0T26DRAFT_704928 [Lasiosphaeria miniovina]